MIVVLSTKIQRVDLVRTNEAPLESRKSFVISKAESACFFMSRGEQTDELVVMLEVMPVDCII